MKGHIIVNIIASVVFILLDPLLNWCGEWADAYSLGAEMVLGMAIPALLLLFVAFAIFSMSASLYSCVRERDIKYILPLLVLVLCVSVYFVTAGQEGLWVRVWEYYN